MKYTEEILKSWTSPLSQTEEQRVENTVLMIKDAVTSYDKLSDCTMEILHRDLMLITLMLDKIVMWIFALC